MGPPALGPRVLALALGAPPWTYVLLAITGLAAGLLLAGFRA